MLLDDFKMNFSYETHAKTTFSYTTQLYGILNLKWKSQIHGSLKHENQALLLARL